MSDSRPATKYEQLYQLWYQKIMSGEWKAGQRIDPERTLCEEYSVSRITVRETLQLLEQKGLISRTQGKGTFVNVRRVEQKLTKLYTLREKFEQLHIPHYSEVLSFSVEEPNYIIRQNLEMDDDENVIKVVRLFYADQTPYTLETSYMPEHFFPGMTAQQIEENGLYNTFATYHITIQRAVETLKPIPLDKKTEELLMTNDAAMLIARTSYWGEEIVEYTESVVRGDFFEYTVYLEE